MEISTSILSAGREKSVQIFYDIEVAGTDYFHIDVMDGEFVNNNTIDFMKKSALTIKHISNVPLDVHLMVKDVDKYLEEYLPLNPCFITVHYESFSDKQILKETLERIKQEGVKVGISIKPATSINKIEEFLPYVNLVQVMTVEPGLGGQKLIPEMLEKAQILDKYRNEKELDYYIEADGGINLGTIEGVKQSGIDIAVVGTAIIDSSNKKETIRELKK